MQPTGHREPPRGGHPDAPYLSVVVAAPYDDPEGNLLRRMRVFVNNWINQSKRHGLESELIIVEWNPPRDRESLVKALDWLADTGPCQVRILEVPPELHGRDPRAGKLTSYPFIARNIGIRRARGQFILATDVDLIFSGELIEFLASRRLEKGRMYRIDRHEVMSDAPPDASVDQQLDYCRTHLIRLCAREGAFSITPEGLRTNAPQDVAAVDSGLYFGESWYPAERYASNEVFRWIDHDAEVLARASEGGILMLEVEPGPGLGPLPQPVQVLDENGATVAEWSIAGRTTLALALPPVGPTGLRSFRLRVPGGGAPVLDELRILNLAVFRCDWAEPNPPHSQRPSFRSAFQEHRPLLGRLLGSYRQFHGLLSLLTGGPRILARAVRLLAGRGRDVFEADLDFQLGSGWSYLEESGGERFRWVTGDAQFAMRTPARAARLALLVEPGPGQGGLPFTLVVRHLHNRDAVIARAPVQGLTYLEFDVPVPPGAIATLCFSSENPGSPTGADARVLNFRVFACGAGAARRATPASKAAETSGWPALTIASRPVTKDWRFEMEPQRRQLADMGNPPFLHTNACADFMLMAREHWFDLRGYGEVDTFSMHLDSLLCYSAHYSGAAEQVLRDPLRVYRLERSAEAGRTPEAGSKLEAAASDDLVWLVGRMRSLQVPVIFNLTDWGLGDYHLAETSPAASATAPTSEAAR